MASIDLVSLGIQEHVMPADLVDLLLRTAEEMKVHFRPARFINAPVAKILVIHPLDPKHVVHGPADGH